MRYLFSLVLALFITVNYATTWSESEVDDPILDGEKCNVGEPMSYGSYIYQWPAKYDQVFWPETVPSGIWFCEKSGFISLIGDFKRLTDSEKLNISEYLKSNNSKLKGITEKLKHLEKIYSLRHSDENFNNRLLRILAYQYESLGEFKLANEYRRKALHQIEARLILRKEALTYGRLESLFLAVVYNKQLGDENKYSIFLNQLHENIRNIDIKNEEIRDYAKYLEPIIEEVKMIEVGGKLAPKLEHDTDD